VIALLQWKGGTDAIEAHQPGAHSPSHCPCAL
jgi:hypothetical protein